MYYSNTNTLIDNTCNQNLYGIYLHMSNSNSLTNNNCSDNLFGIYLYTSDVNALGNNYCNRNSYGIYIESSYYNTITDNICSNNAKYGVAIYGMKNYIHHNRFIRNNGTTLIYNASHIQAYDESGKNFWNTSTEGNYWSDWTSPDVNTPFSIVDNPYILDGDARAKDYFPITTPGTGNQNNYILPVSLIVILFILFLIVIKVDKSMKRKKIERK